MAMENYKQCDLTYYNCNTMVDDSLHIYLALDYIDPDFDYSYVPSFCFNMSPPQTFFFQIS